MKAAAVAGGIRRPTQSASTGRKRSELIAIFREPASNRSMFKTSARRTRYIKTSASSSSTAPRRRAQGSPVLETSFSGLLSSTGVNEEFFDRSVEGAQDLGELVGCVHEVGVAYLVDVLIFKYRKEMFGFQLHVEETI